MIGIDLSAQQIFSRLIAAAIVVTVHGVLVVVLARAMGDRGPVYDGRLSANPLRHIEPVGLVAMVITQFGWSRPVRLTPGALRLGFWSVPLVVLLSLAGVLLFALLLWMLRPLVFGLFPESATALVLNGLIERTAQVAVGFAILNLIPVPPLCAGLVWAAFLPSAYEWLEKRMLVVSIGLGLAVLALGPLLDGPVRELLRQLTAGI